MHATLQGWAGGLEDVNVHVHSKHRCTLHCRLGMEDRASWAGLLFLIVLESYIDMNVYIYTYVDTMYTWKIDVESGVL